MRLESLAIVDYRERITNALIRLLGCSDRSVPSSLYLYCLHATKPDCMFFDGTSAICDDKFAMCYSCKLTTKEVAAYLPPISDIHFDTL